MESVSIPKGKLNALFGDMERMVSDFEDIADFDRIVAESRLEDVKSKAVEGLSEKEVDGYLKARGVKVD